MKKPFNHNDVRFGQRDMDNRKALIQYAAQYSERQESANSFLSEVNAT